MPSGLPIYHDVANFKNYLKDELGINPKGIALDEGFSEGGSRRTSVAMFEPDTVKSAITGETLYVSGNPIPGVTLSVDNGRNSKLTDKHRDILNSIAEGLGVKLDMPKGGMIKKHQNILNAVTEVLAP